MNYYDTEEGREIEKYLDEDMQRRLDAVDKATTLSVFKMLSLLIVLFAIPAIVGISLHGG